jgi:hypothetical protein
MISSPPTHGASAMHGQPDRIEQFKADIAEMRITDPSSSRDRLATRLGLVGLALGVVIPLFAYSLSNSTTNPLQQRDAIVVALLGVAVAIVGGALYLKGALSGFLRFWLARDLHERRAQTDRLLQGLGASGSGGGDQGTEGEPT